METRIEQAERRVKEYRALAPEALLLLDQDPNAAALREEYFTSLCLSNFWVFLWEHLYRRAKKHYWPALHGDEGMCGFLEDWHVPVNGIRTPVNEKFLIVAREHCKTQIGIAWMVWRLARDTSERILLRSHKDDKAWEMMRGVKELLVAPEFKKRFPWVRPAMDGPRRAEWTRNKILLDRDDIGLRTSTIEAYGMLSDPTGGHYSIGYYDDWEITDTANSEAMRPKMLETFELDDNLMVGGKNVLVVGTPYAKDVFLHLAMQHKGNFEERFYDIYVQPNYVQAFDVPFEDVDGHLLDDRVTLRAEPGTSFPVEEDGLQYCQANLTFMSIEARDNVVETREVVWNDGHHFRVNRPIHVSLGQPLHWSVGNRKPAAPNRFTYDAIDLVPPRDKQLDRLTRQSIPQKRTKQGSLTYSCQQELNPVDPTTQIIRSDQVKIVTWEDIKDQKERFWFRAVDLASSRKTRCFTAITTGFWAMDGWYTTHIKYGNFKVYDIILELLLGSLRVQDHGGHIRWTALEDQSREEMLGESLPFAEKNPYEFLKLAGGVYAQAADQFFMNVPTLHIPKKTCNRPPQVSKSQRISGMQPSFEQGEMHIMEDCPHREEYFHLVDIFTMDSKEGFDILDNHADLVREGYRPKRRGEPDGRTYDFQRNQNRALREQRTKSVLIGSRSRRRIGAKR